LDKLELHFGAGTDQQCASRMSILRLSRRPRWASRLDAICFCRDFASVHRNRRKFQTEWRGPTRICARRLNSSKRLRSSFQ